MATCIKCKLSDTVLKAGFVRGKQRYLCKTCDYHFTEEKTGPSPDRRRTQTTIGDVAKAVGVASSTVSRALNGPTDISPNTRRAILEAAHLLDYRPNVMAQSLKSRETHTLGVLIPDLER